MNMTMTDVDAPFSSAMVCELTGATYRQLEHWCNRGYVGAHLVGLGSGSRRRFSAGDVEVVDAVRALRLIGCQNAGALDAASGLRERCLAEAARVVAARPVAPDGEYLVVTLDPPRAQRYPHVCIDPVSGIKPPLWVVPLRSFSAVASTAEGGTAVVPGVLGAVGSRPAPPQAPPPGGSTFSDASGASPANGQPVDTAGQGAQVARVTGSPAACVPGASPSSAVAGGAA